MGRARQAGGRSRACFLLIADRVYGGELSGRTVVLGEGTDQGLAAALEQRGLAVERCGPLPSEMHAAMVADGAALGADRAGRIWYGEAGGSVIADALASLALVLGRLSEGDRPLSAVLDAGGGRALRQADEKAFFLSYVCAYCLPTGTAKWS